MREYYRTHRLSTILRRWLNIIMVLSFAFAAAAGLFLQDYFQRQQSFSVTGDYVSHYADDISVEDNLNEYYDSWMTDAIDGETTEPKEAYFDNERLKMLVAMNRKYLAELSVVDKDGVVAFSSNNELIGLDIRESAQLAPFLSLLDGETRYSDTLYPKPFGEDFRLAYVGRTFRDKSGFMLFGVDESAYDNVNLEEIESATADVKIGLSGYLINAAPDMRVNAVTATMADQVGDVFAAAEVLPERVGEIKESVMKLYGKECYVTAKREEDFFVIAAYPTDEADQFRLQNNIMFVVLFFSILSIFFIAFLVQLKRRVINEVESTHASLKRIMDGDPDERVAAGGSLEFEELSTGINETVDKLKELIAAEEERIRTELENARSIQESAVPQSFPPFPEDQRFGLFASMNTAEAVGGDFYDFFMRDADTLVIVMADVSGKGMPAALYMMRAKTLIKTYAEQGLPVEEVAAKVNVALCEDKSAEMFVTVWLGFLDLNTGIISYVHAGHTYPVIMGSEPRFVKQKINMVLGGLKKAKYVRQEVRIEPGESIFLYTDGVTEAKSLTGDMYGEDRLLELFEKRAGEIAASDRNEYCRAACEMVYEDVCRFADGAEQYDDITMMGVMYKGVMFV